MQTASFTKVEGVAYSSVMITGNLRQAIEGLFAVVSGQFGSLRRPGIFAALCVAFGMGAAVGAYATKGIPDLALGLPMVALLIVWSTVGIILICKYLPRWRGVDAKKATKQYEAEFGVRALAGGGLTGYRTFGVPACFRSRGSSVAEYRSRPGSRPSWSVWTSCPWWVSSPPSTNLQRCGDGSRGPTARRTFSLCPLEWCSACLSA